MLTLAVSLAAGFGAVLRYALHRAVHRTDRTFPYGTFWINVTGSLLFGLVLGLSASHGLSAKITLVVGAGFAGGFTTLSTWAWETAVLAESRDFMAAAWNVFGSFGAGLIAAAAGFGLALL